MTRSLSPFSLPHLSDEAVTAYADGVLPAGPQARAHQHLSQCAECAAAVRDQRSTRILLRTAATPAAPGSLLERLRQLPSSAPMAGSGAGGLTLDGQPVFAAYHVRAAGAARPAPAPHPDRAAGPVPAPVRVATPPAAGSRRLHLPLLGVTSVAAATLIVGLLAGTASTAGGGTAKPAEPATSVPTAPVNVSRGVPANFVYLTGNR